MLTVSCLLISRLLLTQALYTLPHRYRNSINSTETIRRNDRRFACTPIRAVVLSYSEYCENTFRGIPSTNVDRSHSLKIDLFIKYSLVAVFSKIESVWRQNFQRCHFLGNHLISLHLFSFIYFIRFNRNPEIKYYLRVFFSSCSNKNSLKIVNETLVSHKMRAMIM